MRPSRLETGNDLYECFTCGRRSSDASGRTCEACGGALDNIGRSRDL